MPLQFDDVVDLEDIRERLADPEASVRRIAVMELIETAEIEAIPLVIKALRDDDAQVRAEAARVLDEFEGPEVIAALLDGLQDADPAVRQ